MWEYSIKRRTFGHFTSNHNFLLEPEGCSWELKWGQRHITMGVKISGKYKYFAHFLVQAWCLFDFSSILALCWRLDLIFLRATAYLVYLNRLIWVSEWLHWLWTVTYTGRHHLRSVMQQLSPLCLPLECLIHSGSRSFSSSDKLLASAPFFTSLRTLRQTEAFSTPFLAPL